MYSINQGVDMENKPDDQNKKFPEGHFIGMWMGIGVAIFAGLGVPLSRITGHPGLFGIGPALGVVFGLAIGKIVEDKKRQAGLIRPLNAMEKKRRKHIIMAGTVVFLIGILIFLVTLN